MAADAVWKAKMRDLDDDEKAGRLRLAATFGHIDRLSELIKAGVDFKKSDRDGFTALHDASAGGHDACIRLLLESGAELERSNKDGWTALMFACRNGHEACILTLQNAGADPLAVNKELKNAAQLAAERAELLYFPEETRERFRRCAKLLQ